MSLSAPLLAILVSLVPLQDDSLGEKKVNVQTASFNKVPSTTRGWLADARAPEPGVREAFAVTDNELALPGGWYRSRFWVIPGYDGPVLVCGAIRLGATRLIDNMLVGGIR